jgi:hypothetical protein
MPSFASDLLAFVSHHRGDEAERRNTVDLPTVLFI